MIEPRRAAPARAFPRFSSGDSRVRFVSLGADVRGMVRAHARLGADRGCESQGECPRGHVHPDQPRRRAHVRRRGGQRPRAASPRARHRSPEFRRRGAFASIRARARAAPRSRASRRVVVIARRNGPSDEPRALTSPTPTADPQVARVERAARECPPSERPAMLRRWLAVLGAQQDDPARPASPSSSASASTAPDPPSDPEPDPDPETDWDALTLAADESGDAARAGADQDASHGVDLGVDPSDARDPTRLVFSAADADASSTTYSAPGFEPDRETNHDTRIATVSFRFRDVLIRSRALERLVEAYARRPAASTVESPLLLELFRRGDGRRRRRRARRWASPRRRRRRREGRGGTTPRRRFRGHARRGGGEREARGGGGDASRRERDARRRTRTRGGGRRARDDTRARAIGRRHGGSDDGNRIKTEVRFERRGGGGGRGRGRVAGSRDVTAAAPTRKTP